jgi:hypothetical protein
MSEDSIHFAGVVLITRQNLWRAGHAHAGCW